MNFWRIIRALWGIGNYWARWAIIIVAFWPVLITLAAFSGWPALTATVALLPLGAVVFGLVGFTSGHSGAPTAPGGGPRRTHRSSPLVIAAIGAAWPAFLKAAALIVGAELALGVYFAAVPVANDRGLIPLALLLLLAIIFLALSGWGAKVRGILIFIFAFLTAIFLLGGREKAKERAGKAVEWVSKPKPLAAAPAAPLSRTLLVGNQWTRENIPSYHWFKLDPERRIRVRLVNGQEFEKTADGHWFTARGEPVPRLPDVIPGLSVDLRAADDRPTQVVFTTWPK